LERGRTLYLSRCSSCHVPVAPQSIPVERWPKEVKEMSERARLGADEALVVKYLVAQALRGQL
jgi:ferredoxin